MITQNLDRDRLEDVLEWANKLLESDAYRALDRDSIDWAEEILYILFGDNSRLTRIERSGTKRIMVNPE